MSLEKYIAEMARLIAADPDLERSIPDIIADFERRIMAELEALR